MHFVGFLPRYPELHATAVQKYDGAKKMAKAFGPFAQDRATKERSQFVSKVKEVWFKNVSPFALVNNVLQKDLNKKMAR